MRRMSFIPLLQAARDECYYFIMFFHTSLSDPNRLAKDNMHFLGRVDPAKILDVPTVAPGIGFQRDRHHWNIRPFGKLYPKRIEFPGVKDRGPCSLGKDDNGPSFHQPFRP